MLAGSSDKVKNALLDLLLQQKDKLAASEHTQHDDWQELAERMRVLLPVLRDLQAPLEACEACGLEMHAKKSKDSLLAACDAIQSCEEAVLPQDVCSDMISKWDGLEPKFKKEVAAEKESCYALDSTASRIVLHLVALLKHSGSAEEVQAQMDAYPKLIDVSTAMYEAQFGKLYSVRRPLLLVVNEFTHNLPDQLPTMLKELCPPPRQASQLLQSAQHRRKRALFPQGLQSLSRNLAAPVSGIFQPFYV